MKHNIDVPFLGIMTLNDLAFTYNIQNPIYTKEHLTILLTEMLKDICLDGYRLPYEDDTQEPPLKDDGLDW